MVTPQQIPDDAKEVCHLILNHPQPLSSLILPGALAGLIEQIHELLLGTACRSMEPQRLGNVRYPMHRVA